MPTARLRVSSRLQDSMYIRRISAVNTKINFRTLSEQAEETALVNSSATENFIDQQIWAWMGIGKQETTRPLTVYNVDGSENKQGKITHYCWLQVGFQGRQHLQKFFIAMLGKDSIILGYPFLYMFNLSLNFQKGVLSGGKVCYNPLLLFATAFLCYLLWYDTVPQLPSHVPHTIQICDHLLCSRYDTVSLPNESVIFKKDYFVRTTVIAHFGTHLHCKQKHYLVT